ncbi:MAG: DNRLRE domain-containing protein, partial [Bacteroidetes bacterium]|nr:DNRLRE domain-containing protein [Bacteroidota bacterium]
ASNTLYKFTRTTPYPAAIRKKPWGKGAYIFVFLTLHKSIDIMKVTALFFASLFICHALFAQQVVVLNPEDGEDASVFSNQPTTNHGSRIDINPGAWTSGGQPYTIRSFIRFDLSSLPSDIYITDARLTLYSLQNTGSGELVNQSNNSFYIQRVTSSWNESTVTWNTQPSTTTTGQITIPNSGTNLPDFKDIDVTAMVKAMVAEGNYGFSLRLVTESAYRLVPIFSSDWTDKTKVPKLVVRVMCAPAGRDAHTPLGKLRVFPNPAANAVTVECTAPHPLSRIRICELSGREVLRIDSPQTNTVDISTLPSGVYLVQAHVPGSIFVDRLVVVR